MPGIVKLAADDIGAIQGQRVSAVDLDDAAGGIGIGQGVVKQRRGAAHFQCAVVGDRAALDLGAAGQLHVIVGDDAEIVGDHGAGHRHVIERQDDAALHRHRNGAQCGTAVDLARAGDVEGTAAGNGAAQMVAEFSVSVAVPSMVTVPPLLSNVLPLSISSVAPVIISSAWLEVTVSSGKVIAGAGDVDFAGIAQGTRIDYAAAGKIEHAIIGHRAASDRRSLQAASRYFGEHGSKKKRIRRVNERDTGRKVRSQLLLKTLRRVHSRESAT